MESSFAEATEVLGPTIAVWFTVALTIFRALERLVEALYRRATGKPNGEYAYKQRQELIDTMSKVTKAVEDHDKTEARHFESLEQIMKEHDGRAHDYIVTQTQLSTQMATSIAVLRELLALMVHEDRSRGKKGETG